MAMKITPFFTRKPIFGGRSDMLRFILVNDRTPRSDAHCALCCTKLTGSYFREISTRFCYCSRGCFLSHSRLGQLVIEHRAKAVS
jgi:hypothetical protein